MSILCANINSCEPMDSDYNLLLLNFGYTVYIYLFAYKKITLLEEEV